MQKNNLILGGIFVFLLVLAFAFDPLVEWKNDFGKPDNFFEDVNFSEIDNVEISNPDGSISFLKQGDSWLIADTKDFFVTDNDSAFIDLLEDASSKEFFLVSENSDKKTEFQVSEDGARVKLRQGDKVILDFIVGKQSSDYTSTYISLPGKPETYSVSSGFSYLYSKPIDTWYDKDILSFGKDEINKIRFQYPESEFTIEKIDEKWTGILPYSFYISEAKIDKIINVLSNLTAIEIPTQTFEGTGLENHSAIIEIQANDSSYTIMLGEDNGEEFYFLKKGDSDNIYLITKEDNDTLYTSIRTLRY